MVDKGHISFNQDINNMSFNDKVNVEIKHNNNDSDLNNITNDINFDMGNTTMLNSNINNNNNIKQNQLTVLDKQNINQEDKFKKNNVDAINNTSIINNIYKDKDKDTKKYTIGN